MNSHQRRLKRRRLRGIIPLVVMPSDNKAIEPRIIRSQAEFLEVFGKPDEPFAALARMQEGNQLWCQRVVPQ